MLEAFPARSMNEPTLTPAQDTNAASESPETNAPTETPSVNLPPLSSDTTVDQIDQMMADLITPKEETAAPEPPKDETPTEEEPPAGDTPPVEMPRTKVLPNRITSAQFSEVEQEAIALGKPYLDAKETPPPLEDRIAIVKARRAEAAAQHAEANPPQPDPDEVIGQLDAELAAAIAEKDETVESLGIKEYDAKQQKIAELQSKKRDAESAKSQKTTLADAAFQADRAKSVEKAKRLFPSSRDGQSELGQEIQGLISEMRSDANHPDRSILSATNAPVLVAQAAAQRLAEKRAEASGKSVTSELVALMEEAAAAAEPPKQQEPRPPKITTAGGAASIPPAAPIAPKALDLASPESFNLEAIEKAMPTRKPNGFVLRT